MELFYPDSNRIGKFSVLYDQLRDQGARELNGALFALMVVLHVEDHESGRGKSYYAASDLFQPLRNDEEIPEYRIESAAAGEQFREGAEREQHAIHSGRFRFAAVRRIIIRVPTASAVFSTPPAKVQ